MLCKKVNQSKYIIVERFLVKNTIMEFLSVKTERNVLLNCLRRELFYSDVWILRYESRQR